MPIEYDRYGRDVRAVSAGETRRPRGRRASGAGVRKTRRHASSKSRAALAWIVKDAQRIRRTQPRLPWKSAIKQAAANYRRTRR